MPEVRVRFCPSPTGTPHVGLIRSCLFNYVHAKRTGGKFIFRIEDTDRQRDSEDSYQMILTALKWLGLNWDEGVEVGGPNEPYRQSQRTEIYKDVVDQLLEGGFAYKCFSNPEEIDERNEANKRPKQMGYDNFDRDLTSDQIKAYEDEGRKPTIRLKMPDSDITFNDLIRGDVTVKAGQIPDYVIVRANGDPLYTLVNPVDDALMGVNCILRGEDLLSSTPRQIALYNALIELKIAKEMPSFGHLPYVMGEGNKKLSKRDPESNLFLHRENGMIKEGLINYLALLGWSLSPDRDVFTIDELIENFDITKVLSNPARFDIKKCKAINAEHIRMLDIDDFKRRLVPYLYGNVSGDFVNSKLLTDIKKEDENLPTLKVYDKLVSSDDYDELTEAEKLIIDKSAMLIQTRIQVLIEARDFLAPFFIEDNDLVMDDNALKQLEKVGKNNEGIEVPNQTIIKTAIDKLDSLNDSEFITDNIHNILNESLLISEENFREDSLNLKPRFAFTPLRVAISGKTISPPLFESMEILGKSSVLNRLKSLLETLNIGK